VQAKIQQGAFAPKPGVAPQGGADNDPSKAAMAQARVMDAQTKAKELAVRLQSQHMEDQQRTADRQSKENLERMEIFKDHMSDQMDLEKERLAAQARVPVKGVS